MIYIKCDVLDRLKAAGYSSYRIRKENVIAQGTLSRIRAGDAGRITGETLNTLCKLLHCQPGDIIAYTPDK